MFCWLIDGPALQDEQGEDLSFAGNAHLFQWPGALVDAEGVVSTAAVDNQFPDAGYRQWKNVRRHSPQPFVGPAISGNHRDFGVIEQLRVGMRTAAVTSTAVKHGITRPNRAASFEVMQQMPTKESPWIAKLGLNVFDANFQQADDEPNQYELLGSLWVLNAISQELLGLDMFSLDIVELLGPTGAVYGLNAAVYNQGVEKRQIARCIQRMQLRTMPKIIQILDGRIARIEADILLWLEAGSKAVLLPDGTPDQALSLANTAISVMGIKRLSRLGEQAACFPKAAQLVLNQYV